MKNTKSPCKITGLEVAAIDIRGNSMAVDCVFIGDEGRIRYGASHHHNSPWPGEVLSAARELQDRIEQHLMNVYFENGGLDDNATASGSSGDQRELAFPPTGLGEVELGGSEGEPGQV
jgi:hypothetical protein